MVAARGRVVRVFPLSTVILACQIGDSSVSLAECARLFRLGYLRRRFFLPSLRSSAFARPWPDKQLVRHVSTDSTAKPILLPPGWNDTDIHYCYLRGKPLSEIQNIFWEFSLSNGTSHSLSPLGSVPQDRRSKNPSRRGWSGSSSIGKIVCGELLNELLRLVWIGQSSFA